VTFLPHGRAKALPGSLRHIAVLLHAQFEIVPLRLLVTLAAGRLGRVRLNRKLAALLGQLGGDGRVRRRWCRQPGAKPSQLHVEQLDATLILDFLSHIEGERRNGSATRNLRLAAIKSFMRYLEYRVPSVLEQIGQIQAIPTKRHAPRR
jgi:hypothetical protein